MNKNMDLDYKSVLGIFLFIIAFIIGIYMFITPISHVFIHIDELWTAALVNTSFSQCIDITMHDVHPPLYYIIVMMFLKALNALNIQYEMIYVLHVISIIPFFGILIASATKLRKDYGWLTAGVFAFAISSMSEFFIIFMTIRMYGWGIFFMVMAFMYLKDVASKSDRKSWILLSLFTVLGCYTHYVLLVGYFAMYLALLAYVLMNSETRKAEFKKWLISAAAILVLYLPWIFVMFNQIEDVSSGNAIAFPPLMETWQYFSWIATTQTGPDAMILNSLTVLMVLIFILLFAMQFSGNSKDENVQIITGFVMYALTFLLCITVLISAYKSLTTRYLIPVCTIVWMAFAIIMGKIENKRVLLITVILVIALGIAGISFMFEETAGLYEIGHKEIGYLDEMNSADNIVVFSKDFMYVCYHDYLENTTKYCLENFTYDYKLGDVKVVDEVYPIVKENPDKGIYVIKLNKYKHSKFDHNITGDTFFSRGNTRFIEIA